MLFILTPLFVCADNTSLLNEINSNDGSKWVIEKNNESYTLKYINPKGSVYRNNTIITSDIGGSGLFLDKNSSGVISLVMDYPKDVYSFNFSSNDIPFLLSACKQITLPSAGEEAVALLTLCSKDLKKISLTLPNIDVNKVLAPDNLTLKAKVKTVIGSDKSFLYDENKKQKANKPYFIKGDVIEIQEYKNLMLKVKYTSKSKSTIAWINFVDVL